MFGGNKLHLNNLIIIHRYKSNSPSIIIMLAITYDLLINLCELNNNYAQYCNNILEAKIIIIIII